MKKADIKRLTSMLARMDDEEARCQKFFGDRKANSIRSQKYRDAEAIRRILKEITTHE